MAPATSRTAGRTPARALGRPSTAAGIRRLIIERHRHPQLGLPPYRRRAHRSRPSGGSIHRLAESQVRRTRHSSSPRPGCPRDVDRDASADEAWLAAPHPSASLDHRRQIYLARIPGRGPDEPNSRWHHIEAVMRHDVCWPVRDYACRSVWDLFRSLSCVTSGEWFDELLGTAADTVRRPFLQFVGVAG